MPLSASPREQAVGAIPIRPLQHFSSAIAALSKSPPLTSRFTAFGSACENSLPLEFFGPASHLRFLWRASVRHTEASSTRLGASVDVTNAQTRRASAHAIAPSQGSSCGKSLVVTCGRVAQRVYRHRFSGQSVSSNCWIIRRPDPGGTNGPMPVESGSPLEPWRHHSTATQVVDGKCRAPRAGGDVGTPCVPCRSSASPGSPRGISGRLRDPPVTGFGGHHARRPGQGRRLWTSSRTCRIPSGGRMIEPARNTRRRYVCSECRRTGSIEVGSVMSELAHGAQAIPPGEEYRALLAVSEAIVSHRDLPRCSMSWPAGSIKWCASITWPAPARGGEQHPTHAHVWRPRNPPRTCPL